MLIRRNSELLGTSRHVQNHAYDTVRFLLEADGAGLTLTDITLKPGVPETYGSDTRLEVAYCIAGRARLHDLGADTTHEIVPGTLWLARAGERFEFEALEETRLICVFTPPFAGAETGFARDASP